MKGTTKPYQYHVTHRPRPERAPYLAQGEAEKFTGVVKGLEASDLEERFARSLDKQGLGYDFKVYVTVETTIPGEDKTVDFVVYDGVPYPVEVDGNFSHKSAEQKEYDRVRDALVDEALRDYGYQPVQRVAEYRVMTQDASDLTVQEMF